MSLSIEEKLEDIITLSKLDDYMSQTLKDVDFIDVCIEKIGVELTHFIQVDQKYLGEEKNYVNLINFETYYEKETKQDIFKSLMVFVIDFTAPIEMNNVLRHTEKENLEYVALYATLSINKYLKELNKRFRLLSYTTLIPDTEGADTLKCVVPMTFSLTHDTLGECK